MVSSAGSEALEEFAQEHIDTFLLRSTGVDSDAEYSMSNAMYAALIGGITGGFLGGATGSINAVRNIGRGQSIRERGLESSLLSTANYIRNDYLGKGADFDHIQSPALRTLSAAVDAYNKLSDKSGARGAMLLGEIQAGTLAFEAETGVRRNMEQIMANPTDEMAAYATTALGKTVTVEDLRSNKDSVAEDLAVRSFASTLMTESDTEQRVNVIREKIASERYGNIGESGSFADEVNADGAAVYRMNDGRYVIVTADSSEGNEGKYRIGFSETANFDEEHMAMREAVEIDRVSAILAGLADGSMVYNSESRKVERSQTAKNAPASGEGVAKGQVSAKSANGVQVGKNEGNASIRRAIEMENSSIKAQMREYLEKINAIAPVAKISYERIQNKEKLRQRLIDEFSKIGMQVDRKDFGVIQLGKEEVNQGLNYVNKDAEFAAFFAVPKILKRGIVISGHSDHKGRSYETVTIAAPVQINGINTVVGVVVKRAGKNRYKTHRVLLPDGKELYQLENKKDTGSTSVRHALPKEAQRSTINPVSDNSISQNPEKSTDSAKKASGNNGSGRKALPKNEPRKDPETGKYTKRKPTPGKALSRQQKKNAKNTKRRVRFALAQNDSINSSATIDQSLVRFADEVLSMQDKSKRNKRKKRIGSVSDSHAAIIKEKTGLDISGYEMWIDGNAILHIEKRHGINGEADQSMQDRSEIGKIPWVVNHADGGQVLLKSDGTLDLDRVHRNSDNTLAKKVLLYKKTSDGTFFVAECVPDNEAKRLYIKSAYKNGGNGQVLDMQTQSSSPQLTSETPLDSPAANTSISQNPEKSTDSAKKASGNNGSGRKALPKNEPRKDPETGKYTKRKPTPGKAMSCQQKKNAKNVKNRNEQMPSRLPDETSNASVVEETVKEKAERAVKPASKTKQKIKAYKKKHREINEARRARYNERKAERLAKEMLLEIHGKEVAEVPGKGEEPILFARGYTDAEANEARKLVENFDLMPPSVRRAIIEMMRSSEACGASRNFKKHAANLISLWRRGLWIMADDKIRDDGFYYVFDDGTRLITVNPKAEGRSITEALMHELGHDAWARADEETRTVLYERTAEGVKKEEIDEIREYYREVLEKRGDLKGLADEQIEGLLREEVFTNLFGETVGTENFVSRFDGSASAVRRIGRTLSNMKKRFVGKDKYLYRKADDLFKAFARVLAGQSSGQQNSAKPKIRFALNGYSEKQKENWKGSKRIVLYENDEQYRQFVRDAQRSNDNKKIYFGAVSSELAKEIRNNTGIEVENYNCSLSSYEIRKIYKDHGSEATEDPRGQRAITEDDFIKMPIVIQSADSITLDPKPYMGKPVIHFVSNTNEKMTVTAIVSDKHLDLFIQTAYVKSKKGNLATPIGEQAPINTPEASRGTVSTENITSGAIGQSTLKYASESASNVSTNSITQKSGLSTYADEKISENNGSKRSALPKNSGKSQTSVKKVNEEAELERKQKILQAQHYKRKIAKMEKAHTVEKQNLEKKAAVEMARVEEKAAREVRKAKQSVENVKKSAERLRAADKARVEREAADALHKKNRELAKLTDNIKALKDIVTHKKGTVGGTVSAILLEDPSLRAFVSFFAKRGSAYGVLQKESRAGVRALLPWYTADNTILSGNALDELLSEGEENTGNVFGYYNADIRAAMERIANGEGDLSSREITDLAGIVRAVANLYTTYGKVRVNGKLQDARALAEEQYRRQMATRRVLNSGRESDGKARPLIKRIWSVVKESYLYSVVTPEAVLRDLENQDKDGVLSSLYRDIRLGEAEAQKVRVDILRPVAEFFREHKGYQKKLSIDTRFDFCGLKITAAQAVGVWETSLREHAQDRMFDNEKGGIRLSVFDEAEGKRVDHVLGGRHEVDGEGS